MILLSGNTLALVSEATRMARALQPSIVVLEDCDLIAEDRGFGNGPQSLLFEVLDALDGLDADADDVFLLTTNRVELLERALVQRPGRVDLAVEIPRPDAAARRAVLELYGSGLAIRPETLDRVATQTAGTTASFMK
ncbi:AAA family ATPase [Paeniglutamicibacter cryotolerans]|uniref:ATP-dependent 26S proteasome regulatory subunit n=1 Tax=Paeniglutamicibacter cryotolerans TaxID=670079 RepID=A0A839QQE6_9MICC|nr:ATP-dependent 26S proteasome regulatory subunit [Paeniglutamicibacter cryotolerans]